jgi:phosphoribosyl-dephospho-CoA transferase
MCSPFPFLRVHDLVNLASDVEEACTEKPSWVDPAVLQCPWVVVRRALISDTIVSIGVRGAMRQQRWGGFIRRDNITLAVTPQQLRTSSVQTERSNLPAFQALRFLETTLPSVQIQWGPGGSVGFELATGAPVVTLQSDLDLVIRAPAPFDRRTARDLWRLIAAVPATVDVLVETGLCGFSLHEYASGESNRLLVRTTQGPMLTDDPWGPLPGGYQ